MIKKIAPKSYALVDTKTLERHSPTFSDPQKLSEYCLKHGLDYERTENIRIIDNESFARIRFQMKGLDAMLEQQKKIQANAASVQDLVQFRPFRITIERNQIKTTEIF